MKKTVTLLMSALLGLTIAGTSVYAAEATPATTDAKVAKHEKKAAKHHKKAAKEAKKAEEAKETKAA